MLNKRILSFLVALIMVFTLMISMTVAVSADEAMTTATSSAPETPINPDDGNSSEDTSSSGNNQSSTDPYVKNVKIVSDKKSYKGKTVYTISLELGNAGTLMNNQYATLDTCDFAPINEEQIFNYESEKLLVDYNSGTTTVTFTKLVNYSESSTLSFFVFESGFNRKNITVDLSYYFKPMNYDDETSSEEEEKEISALIPHLIVDSYTNQKATAGKDVPFSFTLRNTSKTKTMQNIVVTVKPAGELRIKSSADTIYIPSIEPNGKVTKSIMLYLPVDSKEEIQTVNIGSTFEYFDLKDTDAKAGGDNISINLTSGGIERVRINKAQFSADSFMVGFEDELSYSIINSGFTTLYNAEVKLVDTATGETLSSVYVGSIEPSKEVTEPYLSMVFNKAGENKLNFVLTYEDEKLQPVEVTKEIIVNVTEMPVEPPMVDPGIPMEPMPEEPQGGMPSWLKWTLIIGIPVLVIVAIVIIVKVVRKKRSEFDDEDI